MTGLRFSRCQRQRRVKVGVRASDSNQPQRRHSVAAAAVRVSLRNQRLPGRGSLSVFPVADDHRCLLPMFAVAAAGPLTDVRERGRLRLRARDARHL